MDDRKEICDAIRMDDEATEKRMDALRKRLVRAVKVEGRANYKDLSTAIGQNGTYVQQFVTKRTPKKLHQDQFDILIAKLDELDRHQPAAGIPDRSTSPEVTARLLRLVARLIVAPTLLQAQTADFIESSLGKDQSGLRATETKQEV